MTDLRRLGATDFHILPLVLGGNVFGWTIDEKQSFAVLDAFVAGGGSLIDTADAYSAWVPGNSGGESETIIGAWLKASGKRDQVQIASKVGLLNADKGANLSPDRIIAGCEASLKRLGVETIDLYFAHRDDPRVPLDALMEAFGTLVKQGKVRALGGSNYKAARLKAVNDAARAAGVPHFQVLEPNYNLVHRHDFEGELQDYCVEHNIGVVPYYGLASGFLTGKYRSAGDMKQSVRGGGMGELIETKSGVLAVMDAIAAETGASLAQIALAWLAAQPGVTAPIASATKVSQVEDLLGSTRLKLSAEQIERLDVAGA
ncbi:aldo/keto reductase [Sphingomonas immobilis]|uniref:Aldo/keto reductase n=1 Tax=Sphingomonas immobilis TaxID=3063997 RepID=A0ABT9A642_9SPHN|nr:aldo/keto reductase [Sphingomonas sp. CA1-15]MDO7844446.1 aldo/keto reductase [Sphingomonas sp. CA1-15]